MGNAKKEMIKPLNLSARILLSTIKNSGVEIWRLVEGDKLLLDHCQYKPGDIAIKVSGTFLDSDHELEWVKVTNTYVYRFPTKDGVPTKRQLANAVRRVLIKQFKHEIDEGLWVDGERPFYPH